MKFKHFVKKVEESKGRSIEINEESKKNVEKYWISPKGKTYNVRGMHHTQWAFQNILKKKGYDKTPENMVWDNDVMEKMLNDGWVRVAFQRTPSDTWGLHIDIVVDAKRNSRKSIKALDDMVFEVLDGPENLEYITGEVRKKETPIMMGQTIDFDAHRYKVLQRYF